jgi:hypothetical protein
LRVFLKAAPEEHHNFIVVADSFLASEGFEGSVIGFVVLYFIPYAPAWDKTRVFAAADPQEVDECFEAQVRDV